MSTRKSSTIEYISEYETKAINEAGEEFHYNRVGDKMILNGEIVVGEFEKVSTRFKSCKSLGKQLDI